MNAFDQLHPALQHHIVNSLGWRELRPFQNEVMSELLTGKHMIVLAPTAGGKTEAALFPTLSRMLEDNWTGLSVLYICPIKALLNNLDTRLQRYSTLLGRRSALWHGDVKPNDRKKILRDPPDCLLTTPESLEVMLDSQLVDCRSLFANLQVVIVDEIHAFAGDDRGWHLLSVLERISRFAGREMQRIGLSATVGNPEVLVDWLAGSCQAPRDVYLPQETGPGDADVQLDFVGSIENAAVVISRLHRGEKRLVFVDSRTRAEKLGSALRGLQVTTFVTHSSLSQGERHQAEEAFASRDDCVIVATSVLELGIDVGDLDRVIQIDSPTTVASFLQRMGRTGRRSGSQRNCLFLATKEETLVQAAGLIRLWEAGYIEPIEPPPLPLHVLAQQLMALVLQESGIGRDKWRSWINGVGGFRDLPASTVQTIVAWMIEKELLWEDTGILAFGREGEAKFGRKNFLELFSVFMSPPLFTVLHGRQEIGYVDESTFISKQEGARVLLLGGRAWKVNHIDWQRRLAYVEPTDAKGNSRWLGKGAGLRYQLAQAIRETLTSEQQSPRWSQRAIKTMQEIRMEYAWLDHDSTVLTLGKGGQVEWWTFGGDRVNATLVRPLAEQTRQRVDHDSFTLTFDGLVGLDAAERAIATVRQADVTSMRPVIDEDAIVGLKFVECLPVGLATQMLEERVVAPEATAKVINERVRVIVQ